VAGESEAKAQELAAIVREIRERVRRRYPEGSVDGLPVPLPDLLPILHARDAAEAKMAAIGSVNPRPPGIANSLIQWLKRQIARGLGWFVRDQIDFNRAVVNALYATLDSLNDVNRAFQSVGGALHAGRDLQDAFSEWKIWRDDWEKKLLTNEIEFLRGMAELKGAFEHKLAEADEAYRESLAHQHSEFTQELERSVSEVQKKLWTDLERVRMEYESLIHQELRTIRQRASSTFSRSELPQSAPALSTAAVPIDYPRFADRFRGPEEYVRHSQRFYIPYFEGKRDVLDIGCGRGEFLELMKEAGIPARGIDLDAENIDACRAKGLNAELADLFPFLSNGPEGPFDGIFAAQVIEHLPPERLPEMIRLCSSRLSRGGVLALETPNPECLAIFATHFYLDPTHTRPVPPALLAFYCQEFGLGGVEIHRLSPAIDSMPSLGSLPEDFRNSFFDGLDYCVIARKL
jgi:O-antigen chain-terminating methyltransferase